MPDSAVDDAPVSDSSAGSEGFAPPVSPSLLGTIAVVAVLGFAVPLLVARHYHALGVPRGDDWSYLRALYHWVDTGHLNFNHWVSMTLVGQLVLAAPIAMVRGHDTSSVQTLTTLLGVVGLLSSYTLARACGIGRGVATFLTAIVTAGPLFAVLAVSFMTDVPAFGCSLLCLAIGVTALRRRPVSWPLLLASLAVGLLAFTIREYGAIPPVAVALTAAYALLVERDRRGLRRLLIAAAIGLVAAAVFYAWWRTIPDPKPFPLGLPTSHAISTANVKGAGMLRFVGFWLLPAIMLVGPIAIVRRAWREHRWLTLVVGGLTGAWLVATGVKEPRNAFTGNYFIPEGALGQGVGSGTRPRLIPLHLFEVFVAAGTVGAVVLVLAAVPALALTWRALRRRDFPALAPPQLASLVIVLTVSGYTVGYGVAALAGLPLYDRYVLPVVPLTGVLLLRQRVPRSTVPPSAAAREDRNDDRWRGWRIALAGVALALLCAIGLDYAADSASYDGVRWRVSEAAERAGWAPHQIGGNFEWGNFYSPNPGTANRTHHVCVLVSVGAHAVIRSRGDIIATGTYTPPFRPSVPVIAYRTALPCTKGAAQR
ncbi:MAG TPA: hypothetical protein VGO03_21030 [Acidimicrobiia bacterium]